MRWECTSTDSTREVAERFARETKNHTVGKWNPDPEDGNGPVRALFTVEDDDHQWYEIVGVPPGRWTVTSKFSARLNKFNEWWVVQIATKGFVAAFRDEQDAHGYANCLRDALCEARGLTSAVSVHQNS